MTRALKNFLVVGAVLLTALLVFGLSAVPKPAAPEAARDRAADLAVWARIAEEYEGEISPQALLGVGKDEHLAELLGARGIDEAAFLSGAAVALDQMEDAAFAEASADPFAELAAELELPEGLASPPHSVMLDSDRVPNVEVSALVRRLLDASRSAPRGGNQ